MPNSQFFRRLRRAAPAASSLQRPARLRRPTAAGKASTAAPAVGCRAPMHGVWYSTKYGDGVWSTDRRGPRRKIFLACGAQMFRRLAAKTAFAWGRPAKKAIFLLCTMEYGLLWSMEYWSMPLRQRRRSSRVYGVWPAGGRQEAAGYGVSGPAILLAWSVRHIIFRDIS